MKVKTLLLVILVVLTSFCLSCKNDPPIFLSPPNNLAKIEAVLSGNNQNLIGLLTKVRGSVGKRGSGSKTIWSRKNKYGLGLYISANHVYGLATWSSRKAQFFESSIENIGIFETSQIPQINGNLALGNYLIADFPLMHFDISANVTNNTILPEQDFYIGIIDNQRILKGHLAKYPDILQTSVPLLMYDPNNRTNAEQTWNIPVASEKAIAIGFPNDTDNFPNGAIVYGKILSDIEAAATVTELKAVGDPEGDIPYNLNAEFFIDAQAISGMSGGGVFNSDGQLLGIMVRASDHDKAPKIIRVVRISYIKSKINTFYSSLSNKDKSKIEPFIKGELAQ